MKRAAVVVNATKFADLSALKNTLNSIFRSYGWAEAMFLHTEKSDPGCGQAHEAVLAGVDLVCSLGGDGTVRGVAQGLRGSRMPLGILAAGTGNLLARNIGLPHRRLTDGLRAALSGKAKPIDTAQVELDRVGDGTWADPEISLVMTGIGLDAEIINSTDDGLKSRIGWLAYPSASIRHIKHEQIPMSIALDGKPPLPARPLTSVLIGNCGRLTGGVQLMPNAQVDDGELDTVALSVPTIASWAPLVSQVLRGSMKTTDRVARHTSQQVTVRADAPAMVEIDGDILGRARGIRVTVEPHALLLQVPPNR